jgi:hypothetical protein
MDDVFGETPDEELARLSQMVEEYGEDVLTDDEAEKLMPADGKPINPDDHYANLAEFVEDQVLAQLSQDVVDWADHDESSRKAWYERERKGMVLMGLLEDEKYVAPFEGATVATHPLLAEACTNFQARAIAELWPAGGPVKTVVMGKKTPEVEAQAARVKGFMNYQYTQINGGFDEQDRMLMRLPMSGSCFKKQYFDPNTAVVRSDYVEAADFLVPYMATSLKTSIRYTHRMKNVPGNDIKKLQQIGYYRAADHFVSPIGEGQDNTEVHDAIDEIEGREPTNYDDDVGYTLLECYCTLDLEGFEDVDAQGNSTGIALPYVVTVDKDNQKVLAIRRGWKEGDARKERRVQVTHYKFLPGFGFYGYGFVHVIGGLSQAATGAMRAYLDAAGFANMKGGFKSRDAKLKTDNALGMGEWREVDMTAEELSKCFYPLEYREPSKGLFEMLGYLDEVGRRYTSTTENLVGDANNNGPVGTTLALIEQGLKVFSAIHKRLHEASTQEFRIMADLFSEYLPDEYPYLMEEEEQFVLRADFDERVDVAPVSDPNTVTNTQRIAQAQGVVELSAQAPDIYDMRAVHKRMLAAMQVPKIEELIPPQEEINPMDPITEGLRMLTAQAVQAFPEQDHYAHILAHGIWWEQMVPDDLKKDLEPIYKAHQAEHTGLWYQQQMMAQLGLPPEAMQDPALQNQIAMAAAQVTQLMAPQTIGLEEPEQQQGGEDPAKVANEIALKNAQAAADMDRKDMTALADIERKDAQAEAEIERKQVADLQKAADEAAATQAALDSVEE